MAPTFTTHPKYILAAGDCVEVMTMMPADHVDSLVTDPPAGIGFMNKDWDHDKGGRDAWIAWMRGVMTEARRVLKPGAHGLVWAIPRTSHWTATALEDAGFEIRDVVTHHFGTGFPKSLNVGEGRGTALKPASENWILVRKPCDGTTTGNVAAHGTGGLNIEACSIACEVRPAREPTGRTGRLYGAGLAGSRAAGTTEDGRWPANLVLSHTDWCEDAECMPGCPVLLLNTQSGLLKSGKDTIKRKSAKGSAPRALGAESRAEGSPQIFYGDSGGAASFFYCAKPSTKEREAGLAHLPMRASTEITNRDENSAGIQSARAGAGRSSARANHHPTVKAIALMRWLVRLVTPVSGTVLDPFMGSGSTGVAAIHESRRFIGIDSEPDYAPVYAARLEHAVAEAAKAT